LTHFSFCPLRGGEFTPSPYHQREGAADKNISPKREILGFEILPKWMFGGKFPQH